MHAHVDGELDLVADLEVQRHIEECPRCASEYAALRAMRTRLKDEEFRFEAPAELREKIRRAVAASPQTRSAPQRSGGYQAQRGPWVPRAIRFAVPMAVGAMLALVLAPRMIAPTLDQRLASEVVASHVRSLMASHLMDVASTDQHTVKPWFNGKVDFSPPVSDFAEQGYPLVGGRLDYLERHTVAALVYRRHAHVINVFVWPEIGPDQGGSPTSEQGYHVQQWRQAGMRFAAVSDLNTTELNDLVDLVRQHTTAP